MNSFKFFIILVFMTVQSCAISPGLDLKNKYFKNGDLYAVVDGINTSLKIEEINENLIRSYKSEKEYMILKSNEIDELVKYKPKDYLVGTNDILKISIWGIPELDGTKYRASNDQEFNRQVNSSGEIFLPYAGSVKVSDKSIVKIREEISKRFNPYFKSPQIDVSVCEYNSKKISMTGAFKKPFDQAVTVNPLTLNQAIQNSGGVDEYGTMSSIKIKRDGKIFDVSYDDIENYDLDVQNIILKAGDSVHATSFEKSKAYIFGEVAKQKSVYVKNGNFSLSDIIAEAGGLMQKTSSGNEIYVFRWSSSSNKNPRIFKLKAIDPSAMILASHFKIEKNDVVFIGPSEVSKWNRVISQVFPVNGFFQVMNDF